MRDADDRVVEYVSLFSDITERKQREGIVWRQANFDTLTGLANRSLFRDRVDRGRAPARRRGKKLGLMFIDLDRFKAINDTLGHDVGDELPVDVARRLLACVRDQDTVARMEATNSPSPRTAASSSVSANGRCAMRRAPRRGNHYDGPQSRTAEGVETAARWSSCAISVATTCSGT